MKFYLFLILTFLNIESFAISNHQNCHFYLNQEKQRGCWFQTEFASDYLVQYGYKYCCTFENNLSRWSKNLQHWIAKTRDCLQDVITKIPDDVKCTDLADTAYRSHSVCYLKSGFCELNTIEKSKIFFTLLELDVFLKFKKTSRQTIAILKDCLDSNIVDSTMLLQRTLLQLKKMSPQFSKQIDVIKDIDGLQDNHLNSYLEFAIAELLQLKDRHELNTYKGFNEKSFYNGNTFLNNSNHLSSSIQNIISYKKKLLNSI